MLLKKLSVLFFIILILVVEIVIKGGSISPFLFQVLFNKNIELKKASPERINLLLLGIGGGNHEGPNLSDTIIFSSIDINNPRITLVSLPRDMWSTDLKGKINKAYANGEDKRRGGGLVLAKSVVSKITGQPIDYAVVINFSGFVKAVNVMGGLDINVDRAFDDYEYPIEGKEEELCDHSDEDVKAFTATTSAELDLAHYFSCRYEHVHFDKGMNHMDGERALKFVRSRHAQGNEGTDFARSQRQEKVIKALKDKAFSLQIIANPAKVFGLYGTLKDSINTDIQTNEFDDFIKLAQRMKTAKVQSAVVDYGDDKANRSGLLIHPDISSKYNYEWTLTPRLGDDNFSEIHSYINCELTKDNCTISKTPQ